MAPVLAYWKIRGLAQSLRLLLGYTKTDFEDRTYDMGDDGWLSEKFTLGLDFPNLPYFIDGDLKLTQSNAILRHLGRKFKLDGDTEEERARVDMVAEQVVDLKTGFVKLCYGPNFEENLVTYKTTVKGVLKLFESYLGSKSFLIGEKLTYVDFPFWESLDVHLALDGTILDDFKSLKAYHQRFKDVPEIADFMNSDKFFRGPINGKMAHFK